MNLPIPAIPRKRFAVACPPSGAPLKVLDLDDTYLIAAHIVGWGGMKVLHKAESKAAAFSWLDGLAEVRNTEYRAAVSA